jgi:hypothetical protein
MKSRPVITDMVSEEEEWSPYTGSRPVIMMMVSKEEGSSRSFAMSSGTAE